MNQTIPNMMVMIGLAGIAIITIFYPEGFLLSYPQLERVYGLYEETYKLQGESSDIELDIDSLREYIESISTEFFPK